MDIVNIIIIIVIAILAILVIRAIRKYILLERINRFESLRTFLIYNMGIIRAEKFSYVRLSKIYDQIKGMKESLKDNPHIIYDIVTNTEKDFNKYSN